MIRLIHRFMILAVLAFLLPSCGSNEPPGPQPFGTLSVNGISLNGTVEMGGVRIYTLSGIVKGNTYLVRTVIAPGGTLAAAIYSSFAAYKAGVPHVATAGAVVPDFYEASFTAAESGEYVVVLSGTPSSPNFSTLYFYNLRLMSATGAALRSFTTPTVPLLVATATGTIYPDRLNVYSDTTISTSIIPAGSYTVLLTSPTTTLSHPQMFVYSDNSLKLKSLLYSAVSLSNELTHNREFHISNFSTNPTLSTVATNSYFSTSCSISAVTFTSGGPFIQIRGVSQARYTLSVSP